MRQTVCIASDMININHKAIPCLIHVDTKSISHTININAYFVQNARSKVYFYAKYGILHIETVEYYEYYAKYIT